MNSTTNQPNLSASTVKGVFADLEALRLSAETLMPTASLEVLSRVPVRKPNKQEHVRVCADASMMLPTAIFEDKNDRNDAWFVAPEMREHLVLDLVPVILMTAVNRQGTTFLWPVKIPVDSETANPWHETGRQAAELAKSAWVRVVADMNLGGYRIFQAEGDLPEPEWPKKTLGQLMEIAFRGRVIDNENHPVIQRLRGRM